jgi:Ni,Fe-hydrogenase III large subunit
MLERFHEDLHHLDHMKRVVAHNKIIQCFMKNREMVMRVKVLGKPTSLTFYLTWIGRVSSSLRVSQDVHFGGPFSSKCDLQQAL